MHFPLRDIGIMFMIPVRAIHLHTCKWMRICGAFTAHLPVALHSPATPRLLQWRRNVTALMETLISSDHKTRCSWEVCT